MLFNSIEFAIFLPISFLVFWFLLPRKSVNYQNLFILSISYLFYGWWDYRFLSLIIISSSADFFIGKAISNNSKSTQRKLLLFLSILINLGLLGFFKYYNFFVDSFIDLSNSLGLHAHPRTLNIILPVGISFYTFQTLSYTIDIYRKRFKPTNNWIAFFAFVSFFPQLVAGPIERASNLLPQFYKITKFDYKVAISGMRIILWGLFKKIIIADTCASIVDVIFEHYTGFNGSALLLGAFFFAFQIYGDFSGYSDIAIGTAKLFGFNLNINFNLPYFSRNIGEFWHRWHISLSTWFKDYVYFPLGGSKVPKLKQVRNILITFTVSGLWHGANWTFVAWGFLNGLYYFPLIFFKKNKNLTSVIAENSILPSIKELFQLFLTFSLTLIAWIFFRSDSITDAFNYLRIIFSESLFQNPLPLLRGKGITDSLIDGSIAIIILLIFEWVNRKKDFPFYLDKLPKIIRWIIYWLIAFFMLFYFGEEKTFIYFQF